jgi:urea carboxylase
VEVGATVPLALRPQLTDAWHVGVLWGPHGAPDFFTPDDIETLVATDWLVHHHSDRTGVRLVGPAPAWARADGGEAGLHPSNIHDNAYAVGTVDFTGDMPIVLMRDGPSCGGFVCPVTVAAGELWKLGQARAGDTVRFVPLTHDEAVTGIDPSRRSGSRRVVEDPVLLRLDASGETPALVVRRDGDHHLLVEVGPAELDLGLRLRVGALMAAFDQDPVAGVGELVPGVRSLQIGFDPDRLRPGELCDVVAERFADQPPLADLEVPSRIVHLPLSWDDPATREAIAIYMRTVRADAPWCPWNIEFIRRINGLDSVDDVRRIVFDASYLVLALGDVYLGAPVATPVDPRHRLVTTEYNPARIWTAENSVGIGGAYLCIYGMEGPGGYQFVGRTVQVWNAWRATPGFERPWLLRFFDQIRWEPVSTQELSRLRESALHGRHPARIEHTTFRFAVHQALLAREADDIAAFTARRRTAFAEERARWADAGLDLQPDLELDEPPPQEAPLPRGHVAVRSPVAGSVWKVLVRVGDRVQAGDPVALVEAMKMETPVRATVAGTRARGPHRGGGGGAGRSDRGCGGAVSGDPRDRVAEAFEAATALDDPAVFLAVADRDAALAALDADAPLAGTTLAVKDNIDVAGLPTTAACVAFAYTPQRSAPVVDRLVAAGVTVVGKTNLDQFATGLVGTRSPYGTPRNPFDPDLVPGGSSSGSAVAVARGVTDLALGTDTAGSGRVPAALCGVVGVKPTRGWLPAAGVVPAVRTVDCVSVFARTVEAGWAAVSVAAGPDDLDPFTR